MNYQALLLLLVMCACTSCVRCAVYLAPTSSSVWTQTDCNCGTVGSPCALSGTYVSVTVPCDVYVASGSYSSTNILMTSSYPVSITLLGGGAGVSALGTIISCGSSVTFTAASYGGARVPWSGAQLNVAAGVYAGLALSNIEFTTSTMALNTQGYFQINNVGITYATGTGAYIFTPPATGFTSITFNNSDFNMPTRILATSDNAGTVPISIFNSTFNLVTIVNAHQVDSLSIANSTLTVSGTAFNNTNGLGPASSVLVTSSTLVSTVVGGGQLFTGGLNTTASAKLQIYHSSVNNFILTPNGATGNLDFYNSTLTDSLVDGGSKTRFQAMKIVRATSGSALTLAFRSAAAQVVDFTTSTTYAGGGTAAGLILESSSFTAASNITSSSMQVNGINTIPGTWTHTGTILGALSTGTNKLTSASTSLWSIGPITISPGIDMSAGGTLVYRVTSDPSGGAKISAQKSFALPAKITYLWDTLASFDPVAGVNYTAIDATAAGGFTGTLPTIIQSGGYVFTHAFSSDNLKLLFRLYVAPPIASQPPVAAQPPTAPVSSSSPPRAPPTASTPAPFAAPVLPPTLPPPPPGCPPPAPGPDFNCSDGVWIQESSVTQPELTVPPGGKVQIEGNLTVETTITLQGSGSEVTVNGCIIIGGKGVVVTLTKEEMDELIKSGSQNRRLLTSTNGNDCPDSTDLSTLSVSTITEKGGCHKVKTATSGDRATLNVVFTIDRSRCDIAIIVPSVVGGLILIAAVASAAIFLVKKPWDKLSAHKVGVRPSA